MESLDPRIANQRRDEIVNKPKTGCDTNRANNAAGKYNNILHFFSRIVCPTRGYPWGVIVDGGDLT
jgi:hypothetical protein